MRSVRATFIVAVLLVAASAAVPMSPATAQKSEKEQLEARKQDLDNQIADLDRNIADAQQQLTAKTIELQKGLVQLDVLADDFARTVEARKVPARTRLMIAVDAYERGDRNVNNLLAELLIESTNADEISDLATQRQIYNAVIVDADNKLAAYDQQLRDLNNRVTSQQASLKGLHDQVDAATAKKTQLEATKQTKANERADVQRRLDEVIAAASAGLLTGLPSFEDPLRPALVIKIDNVEDARPPVGINRADVVFEELVEGGLTRMAAVFQSRGSDPVGPVRSARSTDVHLFAMLNHPIFANSGGNGGVRSEIGGSSLVDAANSVYPGAYFRVDDRIAPHNLFANTSELWAAAAAKGGTPPALFSYRGANEPLPAAAQPISGVTIRFPTRIDYQWNGTGWARAQSGYKHVDADGVQITPANVIVQFTQYKQSNADPNSPEAVVTGSGEAWVLTAGKLIRATWNRKDDSSVTSYTDVNGNPVKLTPGSTFVELPWPGTAEPH